MSVDPIGLERKRAASLPTPHFVKAARYSFAGFRRLLAESAFRDEAIGFGVILFLFTLSGAHASAYGVQMVLFLVLVSIEALNTAVEVLVDRISPEISTFARDAKDLGSFAVFCLLCANGGFALLVLTKMAA